MAYDDRDDDNLDDLDISLRGRRRAENVPNYLVLSILTTIFCCWILGIPAIVYAAKANSLAASGDYDGAVAASSTARGWCVANIVLSLIAGFAYCGLVILGERGGGPRF